MMAFSFQSFKQQMPVKVHLTQKPKNYAFLKQNGKITFQIYAKACLRLLQRQNVRAQHVFRTRVN